MVLDMQAYRDYLQTKTFVTPNIHWQHALFSQKSIFAIICESTFCYQESFFFEQKGGLAMMGRQNMIYCIIEPAAKMWNLPDFQVVIKYPAWILWILWCRNKTILACKTNYSNSRKDPCIIIQEDGEWEMIIFILTIFCHYQQSNLLNILKSFQHFNYSTNAKGVRAILRFFRFFSSWKRRNIVTQLITELTPIFLKTEYPASSDHF